jgi:DNA-binding GntR family transcriptional regulator
MKARRAEGAPTPHEVFKEIRSYLDSWGQAPTVRELKEILDCGTSTVQRALDTMEREGWIQRRARVSRGIRITAQGAKVSWSEHSR